MTTTTMMLIHCRKKWFDTRFSPAANGVKSLLGRGVYQLSLLPELPVMTPICGEGWGKGKEEKGTRNK